MRNFQTLTISQQTRNLIDKLLLGKLTIAEISKVTGISEQCLQNYVNTKPELIPQQFFIKTKTL
jgi:insertion element IS1 protein InsB